MLSVIEAVDDGRNMYFVADRCITSALLNRTWCWMYVAHSLEYTVLWLTNKRSMRTVFLIGMYTTKQLELRPSDCTIRCNVLKGDSPKHTSNGFVASFP